MGRMQANPICHSDPRRNLKALYYAYCLKSSLVYKIKTIIHLFIGNYKRTLCCTELVSVFIPAPIIHAHYAIKTSK